jgi:hypothetical protein
VLMLSRALDGCSWLACTVLSLYGIVDGRKPARRGQGMGGRGGDVAMPDEGTLLYSIECLVGRNIVT